MRGLTQAQIDELVSWSHEQLLNKYIKHKKREYLIDMQNENGVAHKSTEDPDVAALKNGIVEMRKEIQKRVRGMGDMNILDTFVEHTCKIKQVVCFEAGAIGITDPGLNHAELKQLKTQFTTARINFEGIMR
jgi:hypothetical protein